MQIICNNCGNELNFPNRQVYVTCPHCYTHLQIEENDNVITATIIENPDLNNNLFLSLNQLATIQSFKPLYNLLHLELEYNEAMEEDFFYSLLVGKPFFPIMSRGIYRLIIGLFMVVFWIIPNVFNWISVIVIAYGGFLAVSGVKEIIKAWRFRQFEKYYFKEQAILNQEIEAIDLSDKLNTWYSAYSKNRTEHIELREKYFYFNLFDGFKIKIITPLLSQGLRLLTIIGILIGFMFSFEIYMTLTVLIAVIIMTILVVVTFFLVLNKSNTYVSKYLTLLQRRKVIIEELKDMLSE